MNRSDEEVMPWDALQRVQTVVNLRKNILGKRQGGRALRVEGTALGIENYGEMRFDAVYSGPNEAKLLGSHVDPLVRASLAGYNTAVLLFGETGSGKESLMHGSELTNEVGVVQYAAKRIFDGVARAVGSVRPLDEKSLPGYRVSLQAFQIAKDNVLDLLQPRNRFHLTTAMTPDGVAVEHITEIPYTSAENLVGSYRQAVKHMYPTEGDAEMLHTRATTCVMIRVTQENTGVSSQFLVMSLPGSERLVQEAAVVRAREGPVLNKEVLALGTILRQMSNPQEAPFCDFTASQTTHMLLEAFGGNCLTLMVAAVSPRGTPTTGRTLEYAQLARHIQNYAVKNNRRTRTLLRRMRRTIRFLRQQGGGGPSSGQWDDDSFNARLQEMKRKLIKSDLGKAKMVEEMRELRGQFENFKGKFQEMVKSKLAVQKRLLLSEKKRLKVSKALVDSKLKGNKTSEENITDKHALEAKTLQLETELMQLRAKTKSGDQITKDLQGKLKASVEENENLKIELVSIRHTLNELHDENQITLDKNKKISAELLTLENTRKTLEAAKRTLEEKIYGPGGPAPRLARPTDTRSASEIAETDKELIAAKAEIKSLGKEVKVRQDKIKAAEAATQKARDALQARSEEFRKADKGSGPGSRAGPRSGSRMGSRAGSRAPSRALNEHFKREREVLGELVKQHSNVEGLTANVFTLAKHYRIAREFLLKASAQGEKWPGLLSEEALDKLVQDSEANASSTDVMSTMVGRLYSLQEGIIDATGKQTELQGEKKALEKEVKRLRAGGGGDGKSIPSDVATKSSISKLQEYLDKKFREKVDQATKSDTQKVLELQDQVAVLRKKNQELSKRASSGDPRAVQKVQGSLQEKEQEIESLKKELNDARERIHELEKQRKAPLTPSQQMDTKKIKNDLAAFSENQLLQLEEENSDLRVKLVEAETELENFQEYMKNEMESYQRQIIDLKKKLHAAGGGSEPFKAW